MSHTLFFLVFNFFFVRGHIPPEMLEIAFIFVDRYLSSLPVSVRKKERILTGNGMALWGGSHLGRLKCTNTMAFKKMLPFTFDWTSHLSFFIPFALFLLTYQTLYCASMLWITIPFSIKNKGVHRWLFFCAFLWIRFASLIPLLHFP